MKLTLWQQHHAKWQNCTACPLCDTRKRVVLARGKLPCQLLFVGEAPGESEDVLGKPFCGPAGRLLDQLIAAAVPDQVRVALTNLVCCLPKNADGTKAEPDDDEVRACAPRLLELIALAQPQLLVCVGRLASDWFDPAWRHHIKALDQHGQPLPRLGITHPAAILRMNMAQRGLAKQRCAVLLANAVADLLDPRSA